LPIDWPLALLSAGLAIGITLFATWASVTATLRERPALLMLPRAPKSGKRILLERVGPLWRRLSFTWKVTFRNLLRYKKRLVMTVVGIAGCTALLLIGLGLHDAINDIKAAMVGMLDPEYKEVVLGRAEIRNTFKVPGVGIVAGAYITEGKVARNKEIRLVRDGIVIHEGKISSLKRFKDDAREVNQGYECGIGIENYNDIKDGDIIECFTMEEIERA
jgi:hypothetical protein